MQFRLTYDGPLAATQGNEVGGPTKQQHRHEIRAAFHSQLKRLWEITPFLNGEQTGPSYLTLEESPEPPRHDVESLAEKYRQSDWRFVPLVTEDLNLMCQLDILFLRPHPHKPGQVISGGDLDNRLKTLLDALRMPVENEGYYWKHQPGFQEKPFYCLLADDKLITKVSVETDQLLELLDSQNSNDVRLVITVRVRPYEMNPWNLPFG
jgi:hypothetical protein